MKNIFISRFILPGFMVPNFLNGNTNAINYFEVLKSKANTYNPFNLLLYEKNEYFTKKILFNFLRKG